MGTIARLHKWLAILMCLVLLMWAGTGLFFLIKPGYKSAYQRLSIKTYPLNAEVMITPQSGWLEYRVFKSVLGLHLLVYSASGWQQLDSESYLLRKPPAAGEVQQLLQDAVAEESQRYGVVKPVVTDNGSQITASTETNVQLTLDWNKMTLSQSGDDTRLIRQLYKLHYLEWSGHKELDLAIAILGLMLLVSLVVSGICLLIPTKPKAGSL